MTSPARRILLSSTALFLVSAQASFASDDTASEDTREREASIPEIITVIGLTGDPDDLTGSAEVLTDADLALHAYSDINRILRTVPGINIQEEDGYGLRPNIGLRGTGLDRSEKITLMEDGVLIAPAPYAAPSAYYFPHAGRMAGVEIIKGAAGVRYGPRTQGGSINLLSTPVPEAYEAQFEFRVGEENQRRAHAWAGGMTELDSGLRIGGLIEGFYDHADGFKTITNYEDLGTGFEIQDWVGKLRMEWSSAGIEQSLELKGQWSDEISNETYLGLTMDDFAADPFQRYAGSAFDRMDADHNELSVRHAAVFDNGLELTSVLYRTEFNRDWFKSDRVDLDGSGPGSAVSISAILDDPVTYASQLDVLRAPDGFTSAPDALLSKHNNRAYYAQGFQTELASTHEFEGGEIRWRTGLRIHEDEMDRFQWYERFQTVDGTIQLTSQDIPGTESNRIDSADAIALFAQAEVEMGALTLVPGVRYESVDLTRENFGRNDPSRTGVALSTTENSVDWWAPGLGLRYEISPELTLFGGIHRGFSPPAPGSTTSDAEEGTNYELGGRWAYNQHSLELIGFFNDYTNILGSCTASTGGGCVIGDQFDGGEAEVMGLEMVYETDLLADTSSDFQLPVRMAYTYTEATFSNSFSSDFDPWGDVSEGDFLPYIPKHQLYLSAGLETADYGVELATNWIDDIRTVAGQGAIPDSALIESRWVADLAGWYQITPELQAQVNVRNLFDETYAVARRPAGLRPGAPQAVTVGVNYRF